MQNIGARDMHGRAVVTVSGEKLGSCKDVVFEVETMRGIQIIVSRGIIGGPDLIVSTDEIIEITDDAIVVKDALVGALAAA